MFYLLKLYLNGTLKFTDRYKDKWKSKFLKMITKLIIVGKGASGKDFLKHKLKDIGMITSVSYTTRPPRKDEINGIHYHYIKECEFLNMVKNNEFIEWNKFANKWYYGTTKKHFNLANLFIMTPSGIRALSDKERSESLIIYLDISEEVRVKRLLNRKDNDDYMRRIKTDDFDFKEFVDFDLHITDHNFTINDITSKILDVCPHLIKK